MSTRTKIKGSEAQSSYHHGDLKSVLLDETARILREEGESALSLRRLASNVGVSRTAPYHHFQDKQALLSAVAAEGFRRFNAAMGKVLKQSRGMSGRDGMRDYVRAYVNFALKNREYYDLMYGSHLWQSKKLNDSLGEAARGTLRSNVEAIRRWQSLGLIASDTDAKQFAHVAWGTLHGISRLLLDGIYAEGASARKMCDTAADMLWQQMNGSEESKGRR